MSLLMKPRPASAIDNLVLVRKKLGQRLYRYDNREEPVLFRSLSEVVDSDPVREFGLGGKLGGSRPADYCLLRR